jgi:hypothetical protein
VRSCIISPKIWSPKRERQYEHIKESLEEDGYGEERAKEIAARTVNKQRAKAGESKKAKKEKKAKKRKK